jgi:uncharacterized membrane protein
LVAFHPHYSVGDLMQHLATKAAEQTPVYYLLARFWTEIAGVGAGQIRALSATAGIVSIVLMYYLGLLLFRSRLGGGMAAALIAVSPFHLFYSQQARPYAMWALMMIVASIALMRAIKAPTFKTLALYTVSLITALFTHLYCILFVGAQCAYILVIQRLRIDKRFLLALGISVLAVAPWFSLVPNHAFKPTHGHSWLHAESLVIFDRLNAIFSEILSALWDQNDGIEIRPSLPAIAIASLVLAALVLLWKKSSARVGAYVTCLLFIPTLGILLIDQISSTRSVCFQRYLTPLFVAVPLCAAGAIELGTRRGKNALRAFSTTIFALFIALGVTSCFVYSQAAVWHRFGESDIELAEAVNQPPQPIVVFAGEKPDYDYLNVCRLFRPDAKMIFVKNGESLSSLPYRDYFLVQLEGHTWRGAHIVTGPPTTIPSRGASRNSVTTAAP